MQYGYRKKQNLMLILNSLKKLQKTHEKVINEKVTGKGSFLGDFLHFFQRIRNQQGILRFMIPTSLSVHVLRA